MRSGASAVRRMGRGSKNAAVAVDTKVLEVVSGFQAGFAPGAPACHVPDKIVSVAVMAA